MIDYIAFLLDEADEETEETEPAMPPTEVKPWVRQGGARLEDGETKRSDGNPEPQSRERLPEEKTGGSSVAEVLKADAYKRPESALRWEERKRSLIPWEEEEPHEEGEERLLGKDAILPESQKMDLYQALQKVKWQAGAMLQTDRGDFKGSETIDVGPNGGVPMDIEALDRCFERDARRYSSGFSLF